MGWYLLTLLIIFPIISSACPIVKTCLHNGAFSNRTCTCECFAAYTGILLSSIDNI